MSMHFISLSYPRRRIRQEIYLEKQRKPLPIRNERGERRRN